MKHCTILATIFGFLLSASAQFSPVQIKVKAVSSKKDMGTTSGNAATYAHNRALRITLRNTTSQAVSGVVVRWGVVKIGQGTYRSMAPTAFGEEQTVELKPVESKVIETPAIEAVGQRWNYLSPEGEKIVGHGVQVLIGGKVVAEEFVPPSYKKTFEKLKPLPTEQDDTDRGRRREP